MNRYLSWTKRLMSFWLVIEFSLIVAGIAIVYSPVLTKDFVQEDFVQVAIRHFDAQAAAAQDDWSSWLPLLVKWGLNAPVTQRSVIRFLRDWLFWADYFASGLNPLGYQLTNLVLHAFASFAVGLLVWQLAHRRVEAMFAGALFAVLSIHAEAVADLPSRGHVLVSLFMVLSMFFYARPTTRHSLILSSLAFCLALISVETAMTLPLILVLYEFIYRRSERWITFIMRQTPFWVILAAYVGLRFILFGNDVGAPDVTTGSSWNFWVAGYTMYASDPFIADISTPQVALVLAFFVFLLLIYRARRQVVFGFLWIPIPLLIAITFPPQERYFYAPSVGLVLALAGLLANPLPKLSRVSYTLGASLGVWLIFIYGAALYDLSVNWRNAGQTAYRILSELQALHPTLPADASLYFVGIPSQIRRAPVFKDPLDIQSAVELTYDDPSLQAYLGDEFPSYVDDPENAYFFEYQDQELLEREDLETQMRGRATCTDTKREIDWEFRKDAEGWEPWNELDNAHVEQNALVMHARGYDPFLGGPPLDIPSERLDHVEIAMSVRASQPSVEGAVYWQTETMDDFGPNEFAAFPIYADSQIRTYQIVLSVVTDERIVRLRLDPTNAPADIAVQSIKIVCR